jgi:hypothetical protein
MAESFLGIHSDIAESLLSEFLCAADSAVLTDCSKMVSATLLQLRSSFFHDAGFYNIKSTRGK